MVILSIPTKRLLTFSTPCFAPSVNTLYGPHLPPSPLSGTRLQTQSL